MNWEGVLIAVDEIWTKSERIRRKLMDLLVKDIRNRVGVEKIKVGRGRIFLEEYREEFVEKIRKTFGVSYLSPYITSETDIEGIKSKVVELLKDFKGTFKIESSRAWKGFEYNSLEINRIVGEHVVRTLGLKVNLKNPERTVYVEVHKEKTYIFTEKIRGPGGLPLGSQGKGIMLFSGGIDSPVAAYLMGKRGLDLDFFFLNLGGPLFEGYVYKVYERIREYFPNSKFLVLDFDVNKLFSVKEGYRQIVLKVIMYKLAERLCEERGYEVIVTGESLGQVSTQTLHNLKILDSVVKIPVLRPLIGLNKEEIKRIAMEIGTYNLSSKVPELCQIERKTKVYPRKEEVIREFERLSLDIDELVRSIRQGRGINIDPSEFVPREKGLIVVDVKDYPKYNFEKGKKYLIVCPKGTTALILARELREEGIDAYALDYKTAKRMGFSLRKEDY